MKIAICDDNMEYINTIENYFNEIKMPKIEYDVFMNGEELLSKYEENHAYYDAVFLDMEMDGINGIEAGMFLREIDEYVIIIFVTNHSKYMMDSFKCEPFRFIIKPIKFVDIENVCNEILKKISKRRKKFLLLETKSKIKIYYEDIIFFESQNHHVLVYTKEEVYKTRKSMNDIYKDIPPLMFIRTHNSFIVNFNYIKMIRNNEVILHNHNRVIPISRKYKKTMNEEWTAIIEGKYNV